MDLFDEEAANSSDSEMGESHDLARRATHHSDKTLISSTKGSRRRNAILNGWDVSSSSDDDSETDDGDGIERRRRKQHFEVVGNVSTPSAPIFSQQNSLLPPISRGAQVYEQDGSEFEHGSETYPSHIANKKHAERKAKMKDIVNVNNTSSSVTSTSSKKQGKLLKKETDNQKEEELVDENRITSSDEPANIFSALLWGSWS